MEQVKNLQRLLIKKGYLPKGEDDGIFGPKTKQAYINYLNNEKKAQKKQIMSFRDMQKQEEQINNLSNEEIIHYANQSTNRPYIIDDKNNHELSVYYNGELLGKFDAIHGKYATSFGNTFQKKVKGEKEYTVKSGDVLGIIAKQNGLTLEELLKLNPKIKNANLIKPGQVINLPGVRYETTEVNPDEATITYVDDNGHLLNLAGNLTTPAGVYFSTKAERTYNGAPSFIRRTQRQVENQSYAGIPSSIHSRTIRENANTNGCTGMSSCDLKTLDNLIGDLQNIPTYILPADDRNKFKIRNGQLTFRSHNHTLTPSYNVKVANPIKTISFVNNGKYDKEQVETIKEFSRGLIRYKKSLTKDLGINDDTYNQLAKYSLGILGVESSYGKENTAIENLIKASSKYIGLSETGPDYKSKYNTYSLTGDNNSIGLTQIRYKYLSKEAKELFDKYNITKESLVNDPQKAAIATMIKLADEYKKQGESFDKAISSWNPRSGYLERVKRANDVFTIKVEY